MNFKDKINEPIKDLNNDVITDVETAIIVDNSHNVRKGEDGNPLRVEIGTKDPFTLKHVIKNALNAVLKKDESNPETMYRYRLLMETEKEAPEFNIKDISLITNRIEQAYKDSPIICGRALDILKI